MPKGRRLGFAMIRVLGNELANLQLAGIFPELSCPSD